MQFASLGSGSKGNATIIKTDKTTLLIDCGFSFKQLTARLARLQMTPDELDAVLITHEHQDHISGLAVLTKNIKLDVWASYGSAKSPKLKNINCNIIDINSDFIINDCIITPVAVPHDAKEPCQFIIKNQYYQLGLLTDVGHITTHIIKKFKNCDALLLETNHDAVMLQNGIYPPSLKQRVAGNFGHLSNNQAQDFIKKINKKKLKKLILMHISQQNNTTILAKQSIVDGLNCTEDFPIIADQTLGFNWINLST